jgi:zinc protease
LRLSTTKNLLIKRATQQFETVDDLLGVLDDIGRFDLPLDAIERDQQELLGLTLEDFHEAIDRYIDEKRMVYVVVGDGATQLARIRGLGYGDPILLDIDGKPVGGA